MCLELRLTKINSDENSQIYLFSDCWKGNVY